MTDVLSRPVAAPPAPPPLRSNSRRLALYGLLGAAWTAGIGLAALVAVSVAGWFAADTGTFSDAVRIGGLAWLVGNASGLELSAASISLVPLGSVLLVGWLLHRAGRWVGSSAAATSTWTDLGVGAGALAGGYAAIATAVCLATSTGAAHAGPVRTVGVTLLLGAGFGGVGTLRGAGRVSDLVALLPVEVRAAGVGGGAGMLALITASGVLFTASLIASYSTAVTLAEGMHAGLVGGAIATLIGLALMPNAVLFAGAFLCGPGFAVGSGTVVAPGNVSTGPMPGFPLLAAVPRSAGSPWLETVLLLVPVAAGAVAGLVAVRRFAVLSVSAAAVRGGLAGLTAGIGFGLLTQLSGGSVGPGRMQDVGPLPTVLLVCALACLAGGAVASAGGSWVRAARAPARSVS